MPAAGIPLYRSPASSPSGAGAAGGLPPPAGRGEPNTVGSVRSDWRTPSSRRLDPGAADRDAVLAAHDEAVAAGAPGYLDPRTGFFVFTAVTLAERGSCCDQGCRHCPWVAP